MIRIYTFPTQFIILEGRYCEYTSTDNPIDYQTFEDFQRTLSLFCEPGDVGMFTWTVDESTPDLVYYQVSFLYQLHNTPIPLDDVSRTITDFWLNAKKRLTSVHEILEPSRSVWKRVESSCLPSVLNLFKTSAEIGDLPLFTEKRSGEAVTAQSIIYSRSKKNLWTATAWLYCSRNAFRSPVK